MRRMTKLLTVLVTALILCAITPISSYAGVFDADSSPLNWVFIIGAIALGLFLGLMGRSK